MGYKVRILFLVSLYLSHMINIFGYMSAMSWVTGSEYDFLLSPSWPSMINIFRYMSAMPWVTRLQYYFLVSLPLPKHSKDI
jgi:hypothetical protein